MRKSIIILILFVVCGSIYAADRPNFIFFIADDISQDDLGCYGNSRIQTPNLDQIAKQGMVFENAYLTISSCSPSRNSIITGRYPHNTGAPELHTVLPKDQSTFVQELKKAGYYTVLSGKNHMAKPEQLGFIDSSDSKPAGSENWIRHLRNRPKDKPFFCWFASHDAHRDWQLNDKAPEYNPQEMLVPPMLYDGDETRKDLTKYYHEVSRTDYYAGELVKELKAQGIEDNTYLIYCADNGRPFPRCKTYLYDSGTKTPFIVRGPGVKVGRTVSLISSIDISATILELAGIDKPITIQGVSFAGILRDPFCKMRDYVFAERNWHVYQLHERMVRYGDWMYIWNAYPERHNVCAETSSYEFPSSKELWEMSYAGKLDIQQELVTNIPQPEHQLFNVKNDPYQFYNLADNVKYKSEFELMRKLLGQWVEETGDSVPKNPTKDIQQLHGDGRVKVKRGDFPGSVNNAVKVTNPGPVLNSKTNASQPH